MYLKLTLRNARRSALDYLLYIFTLTTLIAIMSFSNCVSNFADGMGFQAAALPILVVIIMSVLIKFVNDFMIKQRANEFATYILLGIEKRKLSLVFSSELMLIGLFCYIIGVSVGVVFFSIYFVGNFSADSGQSLLDIVFKSSLQSLICFLIMEIISVFLVKRKIHRLQIIDLMREKRLNRTLKVEKKRFYSVVLLIGSAMYILLFIGIFSGNRTVSILSIGCICVPILIIVFTFFKWLYCQLGTARLSGSDILYNGTGLYWVADMTSNSKASTNLDSAFCISMLFSTMSFMAGEIMLTTADNILGMSIQQYMGFLQISICIIFIVIYFSMLSLIQIMQLKNEVRNASLLFCMGKTRGEIKALICFKALIKLFLPALFSFVIIGTAVPFINLKLNSVFSDVPYNLLFKSLGRFAICFVVLYMCYFTIIFVYINKAVPKNTKSYTLR